jgi:CRISPR-associated endonuclease Cas2
LRPARSRLHALLKQYGTRVQWSAFEARLTPRERQGLLRRASRLIDPATDRLVAYVIPANAETSIVAVGLPRPKVEEERFFVV